MKIFLKFIYFDQKNQNFKKKVLVFGVMYCGVTYLRRNWATVHPSPPNS